MPETEPDPSAPYYRAGELVPGNEEIHNPPSQYHMGGFQLMSISMFWLASNVQWTALLVILLPKQLGEMTGDKQAQALGVIIGASAIFALIIPLLIGPISDRCLSRFGRRRPFMVVGVIVNVIGLAAMFLASEQPSVAGFNGFGANFWWYFTGFCIVQVGSNISTGAYQGVIPDVVLPKQRGKASGYMGAMTQLGSALGIVLVAVIFRDNIPISYGIICGSLVLFLLWTALTLKETSIERAPAWQGIGNFVKGLWISPKKFPDFAWVWITRFLVMFGFYTVQPFIRYYLRDVIRIPEKSLTMTQGEVFLIILFAAMITGLYGGVLSDKIGRKRIVYIANGMMAVGAVALVFCTNLMQALAVGVFFGLGYGAYISVDWALGTDVLPNQDADAGKDMGIWHVAMVLPQTLAAPVAGFLLAGHIIRTHVENGKTDFYYNQGGYMTIFSVAAVALGLGAVLLRNVKKAR
ncbi:MAG TPA: MFS transporter [Fimbriimonadaceae bacterium]